MSATQANQAEFQDAGKPIANPVYLVDSSGNPTGSVADPLATNQVVGTPVYATTTLAAATGGTATLPAAPNKTTYLNGFSVHVAHTSAGVVAGQVTVSLDGGTTTHMNFLIAVSTTYPGLVDIDFPDPIPAKQANQSIVITAPSLASAGIGSITVFGYQL